MEGIFEQSWRWYGPHDPVSLSDVKQTGAHGIVTALHHIPVGEVWSSSEIQKRKELIAESNRKNSFRLTWNVVESLPVHDIIKQGRNGRDEYIGKYKESLINLAAQGITTICYNFMPVLDWLRSNVQYELEDGSKALYHNRTDVAVFDLFILKRPEAEVSYSAEEVEIARKKYKQMSREEIASLEKSLLMALPGDEEGFTLEKLREGLAGYADITAEDLRTNLIYFLKQVIPVAEEKGVKLAIHPDDPPWPVFGLPRVVSTAADLEFIFKEVPATSNGLTFCSGSLGASPENKLTDIISQWYDRIHFVHLRSVQLVQEGVFYEANHLEGSAEMYNVVRSFYDQQQKKKRKPVPMRPDHGHQMLDDLEKTFYPGYSVIGRLRGLAELRGLEMGIINSFRDHN